MGRVDRVDTVIQSVESKVDRILDKLASLEKTKSMRQATMAKILDGFMDPESRLPCVQYLDQIFAAFSIPFI